MCLDLAIELVAKFAVFGAQIDRQAAQVDRADAFGGDRGFEASLQEFEGEGRWVVEGGGDRGGREAGEEKGAEEDEKELTRLL